MRTGRLVNEVREPLAGGDGRLAMTKMFPGGLWCARLALLLMLCWLCAACSPSQPVAVDPSLATTRYLVGADYLTRFPEGFETSIRTKLTPPQMPQLGLYDSSELKVVETQIDWAAQHGIDFFILPYQASADPFANVPLQLFPRATNIDDIAFCLSLQGTDLEVVTEQAEQMSKLYLESPHYFKVSGRPVIFLRDSVQIASSDERLLGLLREQFRRFGVDVFLVGDELRWSGQRPESRRLRLFDALTTHRALRPSSPEHSGYGASSTLLKDLLDLHRLYSEIGQIPVLPVVLPGYNDRGTRPLADLAANKGVGVLPRPWKKGEEETLMGQMLDRYALPACPPQLPMVLVDSWNDWPGDTAIEPLQAAAATSKDASGRQLYSDGYPYEGFGARYLELLRHKIFAVSGTLLGQDGTPLSGVWVAAWKDGNVVAATDQTDGRGRFHLSRLTLPPGDYRVGASLEESVPVSVLPTSNVMVKLESRLSSSPPATHPQDLEPYFPGLAVSMSEFLAGPAPPAKSYKVAGGAIQVGSHLKTLSAALAAGDAWEPKLTSLLEKWLTPGQTVVEIGTGAGVHTLAMSRLVGKSGQIYAFEPDRRSFRQLLENCKAHGASNVKAFCYAIGGRAGLVSSADGSKVERRSLDSFHLSRVDLLRVDLEEMDADILFGARRLLAASRPKVLWKLNEPSGLPRVLGEFASVGYRCHPLEGTDYLVAVPLAEESGDVLIDLGGKEARQQVLEGFSIDERDMYGTTYAWSEGDQSLVYLPMSRVGTTDYTLGVRAKAFEALGPVKIHVLVNGALAGEIEIATQWTGAEVVIPDGLLIEGQNTILFRYGTIARPWALIPGSLDARAMSVAIDRIWVYPRDL